MPPLGGSNGDSATDRVRRLLAVPARARGREWNDELAAAIPHAWYQELAPASAPDSGGFPCLLLSVEGGGDARRFDDLLARALEDGLGMVLRPHAGGVDVELSFGRLATYRMFGGWHTPAGWTGGAVGSGPEVLQRAERIVLAAPNEAYLPTFIRSALRRHLQAAGIHHPRVLLVIWPDRSDHRDLVFSVEQSGFRTPDAYETFMRSLIWFLPEGYQFTGWDVVPSMQTPAVPAVPL